MHIFSSECQKILPGETFGLPQPGSSQAPPQQFIGFFRRSGYCRSDSLPLLIANSLHLISCCWQPPCLVSPKRARVTIYIYIFGFWSSVNALIFTLAFQHVSSSYLSRLHVGGWWPGWSSVGLFSSDVSKSRFVGRSPSHHWLDDNHILCPLCCGGEHKLSARISVTSSVWSLTWLWHLNGPEVEMCVWRFPVCVRALIRFCCVVGFYGCPAAASIITLCGLTFVHCAVSFFHSIPLCEWI